MKGIYRRAISAISRQKLLLLISHSPGVGISGSWILFPLPALTCGKVCFITKLVNAEPKRRFVDSKIGFRFQLDTLQ
jgi:hypothetical protein